MPGGAPGLQNQCGADKVPGGFDSHSPPPFNTEDRSRKFSPHPCGGGRLAYDFYVDKKNKNHHF